MVRVSILATTMLLAAVSFIGPLCGSASATVLRGSDVGNYTGSYADCGFTVDVAGEFSSMHSMARVGKHHDAGAFFGHDNYTAHEVHTRRDTDASLIITSEALLHDVRASRVEGSVFRFTTIEVGRFEITANDGTILSRDRGQIRRTYLFDTLGDSTPGGQFLELLSEEFHGRFADFDLCAALSQ